MSPFAGIEVGDFKLLRDVHLSPRLKIDSEKCKVGEHVIAPFGNASSEPGGKLRLVRSKVNNTFSAKGTVAIEDEASFTACEETVAMMRIKRG